MSSKQQKHGFVKNVGFVTAGWLANFLSMFVVGVIVARYLGPEGKGQIAIATSTGVILGSILCLGFDRAAPYFIASKKLSSSKVLGCWIVSFFIGIALAYGLFYPLFIMFLMDSVFSGVSKLLLLVASLMCPIYMLQLMINSIMSGREDFFRQTCHNISIHVANFSSAIIGIVILHFEPVGYIGTRLLLAALSLCYGFFILKHVTCLMPEFSWSDWYQMFRYGIKAALSQIFNLIDLRLDIYFVNYFVGTSLVGIYTVAGALAAFFWVLPTSVATVLFPKIASTDPEQSKKITAMLCRNSLWQTVIFGSLFLLVSRQIITWIYGPRFASASVALALLMPGIAGQVISKICYTDCSGRGFPEKATIGVIVTATITIVCDLLLISKYGIYGAAVASSIAYCSGAILGLYWHIKLTGNRLTALLIPAKNDWQYYKLILTKIKGAIEGRCKNNE